MKIGNFNFPENAAFKIYQDQKYILTYSHIYQLFYSSSSCFTYAQSIYYKQGLTPRGKYQILTGSEVNRLLGYQLVNE